MRADPERTPVLVAAGQSESRDGSALPLDLMENAVLEALEGRPGLGQAIERCSVVNVLTRRSGPAPASDLAKRLGIAPAILETTSVGGNTPQALVTRAATDIALGRLSASLIAGAEAVRTGRLTGAPARGRAEGSGGLGAAAETAEPSPAPDPVVGSYRQDLSDEERAAGLIIPVQVYPLIESVLATRAGRGPAEQRGYLGEILAPFSEVAAANPHAWFRDALTADEIATVTPGNRLVAEPYTKRMTAFLGGAQGAAVVVCSLATAQRLGVDDGAVFVWAGASCDDVWYPVARPDLGASPAIAAAGRAVLDAAGAAIGDVGLFDLYSCFPSAVQLGAEALGLGLGEPGRLTLTGGLPYFGGPGNNYTTHALAALFERMRGGGQGLGLVSALGWYATKHAIGLYGSSPPPRGFLEGDTADAQRRIDASALPVLPLGETIPVEGSSAAGAEATVDASTVFYDRAGEPIAAPVYATLRDGRRLAAAVEPVDLASVSGTFLVGARIAVTGTKDGSSPTYRVITR